MSKPLTFIVSASTHGKLRKYRVHVYNNLESMYKATDRWHKSREEEPSEHNFHAITHSYNRLEINDDGSEIEYADVGVIRLAKGYLHSYIIAHEICHATLNIYQLDCVKPGDTAEEHIDPGNETFCHILSELEHNIVSKLHRKGAYL